MIKKDELQKHSCYPKHYPNICLDENSDLRPQLSKQSVFIFNI